MKSQPKAAGKAASKLISEKIAELGDWRCDTLAATIELTSVTDDAQHQFRNDEQDDGEFKQLGSRCLRLTIEHGVRRPNDFKLALDTSAPRRGAK